MFNFLKKDETLVAIVDGKTIPLEQIKDDIFSSKMLGDGIAFENMGDKVVSPIDGTVVSAFPTGHAYGIKTKKGVEVLIHIGIDTVSLKGEGFTSVVKQGEKVKKGQPLVKLDNKILKNSNKDLSVIMIITDTKDCKIEIISVDNVEIGQSEVVKIY